MVKLSLNLVISVVLLLLSGWEESLSETVRGDRLEAVIGKWAEEFGNELWTLGQSATKLSEVKDSYKSLHVRVDRREGEKLLDSIVKDLQRMVERKLDSVKRIVDEAEDLEAKFDEMDRVKNYTYFSSKNSIMDMSQEDLQWYKPMTLEKNRHFHCIPVNTNHSSVHVPSNLLHNSTRVQGAIQWSDDLDEVFLRNFEQDPALKWQYFGESSGFLRMFPAMEWNTEVDQYDYRFTESYIGSVSSPKDMIILMDSTGSMTGMRLKIARLTVHDILDTLSNKDYFNVFNFSVEMQAVIPCYNDQMVAATPENINMFKKELLEIKPEGHGNFSVVFTQAFQLLQKSRESRGCGDECNQVIMLVSDGVPYNITDVFEEYNRLDNGTRIPVRVFTHLIGMEVFNVREIQLIGCLNKGYYVHIHSLNEARERTFKYIPVLSRPLVLQHEVHPITWTSLSADINDGRFDEWLWDVMEQSDKDKLCEDQKERLFKYERNKKSYFSQQDSDRKYVRQLKKEADENEGKIRTREYRLMISVSMPAFQKEIRLNNTPSPDVLGVAGTDIYLDHIRSLTRPYKIGVNGYAFIISNNGYLVLHPELRPVSDGVLKENFNSIDLLEVELLDDDTDNETRTLPPQIMQLREAMMERLTGKLENIPVKYHYDNMHRVAVEERNYYYAPLEGTPFSVGLALPSKYGFYSIKVQDETIKTKFRRKPLSDNFYLYNWKLRPDWVFCRYHHTHKFNSSEHELRHFLEKMSFSNWTWHEQYKDVDVDEDGNRPTIHQEAYYCNKELVLLLLSDAVATNSEFGNPRRKLDDDDEMKELLLSYNVTLRFISTQSGLTRWQYMLEGDEKEYHRREFGNLHKLAIDEPWYISAILQHHIDPDSFVFSLAFDKIGLQEGDAMVTAGHAIFQRDAGNEAPAAVIGMQFRQTALYNRFMKITSTMDNLESQEQCGSDNYDCFVLDSGGYILISENANDTGLFFGEVDGGGSVMEAMVSEDIYRRITVFDYQALCFKTTKKVLSGASFLFTPLKYIQWLLQWLFGEMVWTVAQTNFYQLWMPVASAPHDYDYYASEEIIDTENEDVEDANQTSTTAEPTVEYDTVYHPCDQKADLYLLQPDNLKHQKEGYCKVINACSRPFYLHLIPHTNLLLAVIDANHRECGEKLSADMEEIHTNATHYPCQKGELYELPRMEMSQIFTQHPLEEYITECGDIGSQVVISAMTLIICFIIFLLTDVLYH